MISIVEPTASAPDDIRRPHWLDGEPMDPAAVPLTKLPAIPGFPYVYRGAGVLISGPTGAGRSSLVQAGAYDAAHAGLRVAYLGSEVTRDEFNARAADLARRRGDTVDEELRQQLTPVRYLDLVTTITHAWQSHSDWARLAAERFDVIAIDPLSVVASVLDLDFDKSNADFVKFYSRLIQPPVIAGLTILMLDNVGHAAEAKARAKGASAKADVADLTISCALHANPTALALTVHKVRSVRAPFQRGDQWLFDRDNQRTHPHGSQTPDAPAFRPTVLMERVSRAVEETPGLTINALRTAVKGTRNDVKDLAIEILVAEGYLEQRDGARGARNHHSLKPYREPTESTMPDRAPTMPRAQTELTVPTVPPSYKEGHGAGHTPTPNGNHATAPDWTDAELQALIDSNGGAG